MRANEAWTHCVEKINVKLRKLKETILLVLVTKLLFGAVFCLDFFLTVNLCIVELDIDEMGIDIPWHERDFIFSPANLGNFSMDDSATGCDANVKFTLSSLTSIHYKATTSS